MRFTIRFTVKALEKLDHADELIRDEFRRDAFLQLEQDPAPGGGNLVVVENPNPDRAEETYSMFLERTTTIIAYRIVGNTVTIVDLHLPEP